LFESLTIAMALPLLGSGMVTDLGTSADVTGSGGLAPAEANQPAERMVNAALTLASGVRLRSRRTTFSIIYAPRWSLEYPEIQDLGRPLLLHELRSRYDSNLSPRTNLNLNLDGSAGEVSYGDLRRIFDPGTGTIQARVVPLFRASLNLGLSHHLNRIHTLGTSWLVGYRGPLDDPNPDGSGGEDGSEVEDAFPTSYNVSGTVSDAIALSVRDQLTLNLRGGYLAGERTAAFGSSTPSELLAFGSDVGWSRTMSARSTMNLTAGAALSYSLDVHEVSLIPNLVFAHSTRWQIGRQVWTSSFTTGVNGFVDEVSATFRSQGMAGWSLNGEIGRDWSTGVEFHASTALDPDPIEPAQYESNISLALPTRYRVTLNSELSFGATAILRAPHILGTENLTSQGELTVYLGYRVHFGTSSEQGSWVF
jgi:hypothetical protein